LDLVGIEPLSAHFGDSIVYRDLEPVSPRLPGLSDLWADAGLPAYRIPRKTEPAYSQVLIRILDAAQRVRFAERGGPTPRLEKILFIGDNPMSDATFVRNLATLRPLRGFIGSERLDESSHVTVDGLLYFANRWSALADFLDWAAEHGMEPGENLALLVDVDKTALGARGRNDGNVDRARRAAAEAVAANALGDAFDAARFRLAYDDLNRPAYHAFTADNQDFVGFASLMIAGGVYDLRALHSDLEQKRLPSFRQFMAVCGRRLEEGRRAALTAVHQEVWTCTQAGDPTPFKRFRCREFETTTAAMLAADDSVSAEEALADHIVLTREVLEAARLVTEAGALPFLVSDKPSEASIPRATQPGTRPVHRVPAYVVGEPLSLPRTGASEDAIRIPQAILDDMIAHAREGKPEEVCGVLAGRGNLVIRSYRATNAAERPIVTYNIAPKDQYLIVRDIDEHGEELVAIYHSHPASPAYPSATDQRLAFYPEAVYIILSLAWPDRPIVRGFWLDDQTIRGVRIQPVGGELHSESSSSAQGTALRPS